MVQGIPDRQARTALRNTPFLDPWRELIRRSVRCTLRRCRLFAAAKADRKHSVARKSFADTSQTQDFGKRASVHGPKLLDQSQILRRTTNSGGSSSAFATPPRKADNSAGDEGRKSSSQPGISGNQVAPEPGKVPKAASPTRTDAKREPASLAKGASGSLPVKRERSLSRIKIRPAPKLKSILIAPEVDGTRTPDLIARHPVRCSACVGAVLRS
jgi:hypothetical protein